MRDPKQIKSILTLLGIYWWNRPERSFWDLLIGMDLEGNPTDAEVESKLEELVTKDAERAFLRPIS
jgi:hypothetical protein